MTEAKQQFIALLQELAETSQKLWNLYEQYAPTSDNNYAQSELDSLDVGNLFPMSVDEWHCEITAKIDELQNS